MTLIPVEDVCVLKKLKQVTLPFYFPVPRWHGLVNYINTKAKDFIDVDMDSCYWQVVAE